MFNYIDDTLLRQWWLGLTAPQQEIFRQMIQVEIGGVQDAINSFPSVVDPHEFKASMVSLQTNLTKLKALLLKLETLNAEMISATETTQA